VIATAELVASEDNVDMRAIGREDDHPLLVRRQVVLERPAIAGERPETSMVFCISRRHTAGDRVPRGCMGGSGERSRQWAARSKLPRR
jgi:hypothetical protein